MQYFQDGSLFSHADLIVVVHAYVGGTDIVDIVSPSAKSARGLHAQA